MKTGEGSYNDGWVAGRNQAYSDLLPFLVLGEFYIREYLEACSPLLRTDLHKIEDTLRTFVRAQALIKVYLPKDIE